MKLTKMILVATMAAVLLVGVSARAGMYTTPAEAAIPVGNPVGISSTITSSGFVGTISSLTVTLDITGGNNGDLVGYLSYDGVVVTLLNRPGVTTGNPIGSMGQGFNVTIYDSPSLLNLNNALEAAGQQVQGNYNVNGTASLSGIGQNDGSAAFATAYGGMDPNGTWTLFLANDVAGGQASTLVSWGVSINAVPEPTNVALGIFGVCAAAARLRAGWKKFRPSLKSIAERI
jgi:subtilisin-like proprotein convertase family protein